MALRARLRPAMEQVLGGEGGYGVFVRSDTNVEDLSGFTGAGLNLTVPNVVGFERAMRALSDVWASPYSARAYGWRQMHMAEPQHVYTSVLLLKSVPAEKSGVLVTADVDSGDPSWLSVAVNEGVGGAVDGQLAESLRIHRATGAVRLLTSATAPKQRVLLPQGGVSQVPASGAEAVLSPSEIQALRDSPRACRSASRPSSMPRDDPRPPTSSSVFSRAAWCSSRSGRSWRARRPAATPIYRRSIEPSRRPRARASRWRTFRGEADIERMRSIARRAPGMGPPGRGARLRRGYQEYRGMLAGFLPTARGRGTSREQGRCVPDDPDAEPLNFERRPR